MKKDAAQDKIREFTKYQQTWNIKNSWLKSSDSRFLRGTIERQVQAAVNQQEVHIQDRRDRSVFMCSLLTLTLHIKYIK